MMSYYDNRKNQLTYLTDGIKTYKSNSTIITVESFNVL